MKTQRCFISLLKQEKNKIIYSINDDRGEWQDKPEGVSGAFLEIYIKKI